MFVFEDGLHVWATLLLSKTICREKIYILSFFCVQASTRILISAGHNCEWHNRWSCGPIIPSCNWAFTSQWKGSAASLLSPSPHKLVFFILASGVVFRLAGWFGSVGTCPQLWAHMCCLQKQMPGLPIKCKWCRHIQQHKLQSTCACSYWDGRIHTRFLFKSSKLSPDTSDLDLLLLWRVLWKPTLWKSSNCDVTNQLVPIEM